MKKSRLALLAALLPAGIGIYSQFHRPSEDQLSEAVRASSAPLASSGTAKVAERPKSRELVSLEGKRVPHKHGGDCISCSTGKPHAEPVRLSKVLPLPVFEA